VKGFIQIKDRDESTQIIAVDQIVQVGEYDKYHPNEYALITLKDGRTIKTSFRHNVESIGGDIAEAMSTYEEVES
jgi:hypothetical protein